jgi:hypothetical protein
MKFQKEGCMKRDRVLFLSGILILSFLFLSGNVSVAGEKASRENSVRNVYRQILAGADKNGDGKISIDECMSLSKDKKKMARDCKYWDADGDGVITEDEYVKQALKIMR